MDLTLENTCLHTSWHRAGVHAASSVEWVGDAGLLGIWVIEKLGDSISSYPSSYFGMQSGRCNASACYG